MLHCLAAMLILSSRAAPAFSGQQHFRFGTVASPDSLTYNFQKLVLTEAFLRLGWTLDILAFNDNSKLLGQMEAGEIDGDAVRVCTFNDDNAHPGYVKVDVGTLSTRTCAYTASPVRVTDWASLDALDGPIGYAATELINEKKLKAYAPNTARIPYHARREGFAALSAGAVEIFIVSNNLSAVEVLQKPEFIDSGIRRAAALMTIQACPFFNVRYADLVPVVAKTLRQMKREGVMNRILADLMMN